LAKVYEKINEKSKYRSGGTSPLANPSEPLDQGPDGALKTVFLKYG